VITALCNSKKNCSLEVNIFPWHGVMLTGNYGRFEESCCLQLRRSARTRPWRRRQKNSRTGQ